MLSTLLERALEGIDDAASAPALKAQLEMLKTAAELLEKENTELKAQNALLKQNEERLAILEKEIAELNQYEDLGIIKIKIDKNGKRLPSLYCPQCGGLLTNPEHITQLQEQVFNRNPIPCMKNCGYRVHMREILRVLNQWDSEH